LDFNIELDVGITSEELTYHHYSWNCYDSITSLPQDASPCVCQCFQCHKETKLSWFSCVSIFWFRILSRSML